MKGQTPSLGQMVLDAINSERAKLHTTMPATVISVDAAGRFCTIQPSLQRLDQEGNPQTLPPISNCPIEFYRAGNAGIFIPLAPGHAVKANFCERSLDKWITSGGIVDPADKRKHHLSDCSVYPGLYSANDPPVGWDPKNLVIVNGPAAITMTPDGKYTVQGANDELFQVLIDTVQALIDATIEDPITAAQPFTDVTIEAFQMILGRLQGMQN